MTNTTMGSLREVQKLDERIREIEQALAIFDERLAEVEEPALALESELTQLTERLSQMNADARSLERSADDKRARAERMDQRLNRVSNLREEAAVQAELEIIRRAIEGDEQEALQILDQIRRSEMAVEELSAAAEEARSRVGPEQEALHEERRTYSRLMEDFRQRRKEILEHVGEAQRRVYDAFHQSGRPVIVAPLLEDGACGHCFGLIPLQLQNEIQRSQTLIRCENCGVILTTEPEPVLDQELERPVELPSASVAEEAGGEEGELESDDSPSQAGEVDDGVASEDAGKEEAQQE